jgi:hypothetical protein
MEGVEQASEKSKTGNKPSRNENRTGQIKYSNNLEKNRIEFIRT